MDKVSQTWQTPALWNTKLQFFLFFMGQFHYKHLLKSFHAVSHFPSRHIFSHPSSDVIMMATVLTMGIIFFSHNGFWFPPFGKILATINTPRSRCCGSQTLLWAKMRPSVASGLSCQRSIGISKSQSLYCSPGYNGHMEIWPLSRSPLWTSEKVTMVWHTCECRLNSFFLSRSCLFSDSWL